MALLIAMAIGALVVIRYWRQLLMLLTAVLIAIFCLGLIDMTQLMHH